MIKIFGYNILKDWELERIKKDHWNEFKKYLKIKELWRISTIWGGKPKCNACDDKRQVTVTMPDGSTRKINCSCANSIKSYEVVKVEDKCVIAVKGRKVYMATGFSEYSIVNDIIFSKKDFDNHKYLDNCYFVSKNLAEQALKIVKEKD
jgi:hypothetical protein